MDTGDDRRGSTGGKGKTTLCPTPADKMCCALSAKAWQMWKKTAAPRRLRVGLLATPGIESGRVNYTCIVDREELAASSKKKKSSMVPQLEMTLRYHAGDYFTKIQMSGNAVLFMVEFLLLGKPRPDDDMRRRLSDLGWDLRWSVHESGDRVLEVLDVELDATLCALVVSPIGEIFLEGPWGLTGARRVLESDADRVAAAVPRSQRSEFLRKRYHDGRVDESVGLGTPATATALLILFFNVAETTLRVSNTKASMEVVGDDASFEWTKFEENHLLMPLRCGAGLRDRAIPNVVAALGYDDLAEDLMYARKGVWSGRSGATGGSKKQAGGASSSSSTTK